MGDLEKTRGEQNVTLNKYKQDLMKAKKEVDDSKTGSDETVKIKKDLEESLRTVETKDDEIEQLKKSVTEKDSEINKSKATVMQLKKIGRNFREKAEAAEKTAADITEEKKKIEEELE